VVFPKPPTISSDELASTIRDSYINLDNSLDAIIEPILLLALAVWLLVICALVLAGTVTVLTFPLGIWITRPAGPRLKTSWFDRVTSGPP
jgi:hypothetical protein